MALIAHFPLDGRLDNLVEGSNITLTNNGATVSNYGKLGQCYESKTDSQYISSNWGEGISSNNFTISMWYKQDLKKQVMCFGTQNGTDQRVYVGTHPFFCMGYKNSSWAPTSKNIIIGKWYHLCLVSSIDTVKLYVDGIIEQTKTGASFLLAGNFNILTHIGSNQYCGFGAVNDLKIFDHALSDAEVAGLVATRKLLNSDGVERIGKSIKKEMKNRGNKPYPLPEGATFAADFRKSLCAWTPTGMMEPLGYDRAYESETGVYKNSLSASKKLDIQQTDKGVWIGYGSENLWTNVTKHNPGHITHKENGFVFDSRKITISRWTGIVSKLVNVSPGDKIIAYIKISSTTATKKTMFFSFRRASNNATFVDPLIECTKIGIFKYEYVVPSGYNENTLYVNIQNSGDETLEQNVVIDVEDYWVEKNPISTPKIEKSRGISTLLYPHKFTGEGTTTVIKFYGKIHEGPYKSENANNHIKYFFSAEGSTQYGYNIIRNKENEFNSYLNDGKNTVVILSKKNGLSNNGSNGVTVDAYVNKKYVGHLICTDERTAFETHGQTSIGKRGTNPNIEDSCFQTYFTNFLHFNRELTEKEIEYISDNEIEIPYKELSPKTINQHIQKDTVLSWNSIRNNYDTYIISDSSTDLPLKPSKTYIIIDSNGNRYKSKISATGVVTACTGSTNVLSNVSGMIRVTGSVTFPVSVEII